MVGIVVVGHGRLAEEMVRTVENVLGPVDALEAVVNEPADPRERVRARIEEAARRVDRGRGVLILSDMLGDTETNQALAFARTCGAEVIAGVNMPMLMKLANARKQTDARALAGLLRRYGQDHIVWATESPAVVRKAQWAAVAGEARATLTIRNAAGLHLRAAANLVKTADQFDAEVAIAKDGQVVNGRSIMGVMMLAAEQGSAIEVTTTGPQAEESLAAITALVEAGFNVNQ